MICILHGYLLDGSGSNLWTRSIVEALCREGISVHLVCQDPEPERYDFIAEALLYTPDGEKRQLFRREPPYAGRCILHKPQLGDTLPVYVPDRYAEFARVVPMVELGDDEIEAYLELNLRAVRRIVTENGISVIHANHAVLQSVVAYRAAAESGIPFAVMPHGSAIEYAVKRDPRLHRLAAQAFARAGRVFVIGPEMRARVLALFPEQTDLESKLRRLVLGVDSQAFRLVDRADRHIEGQRLLEAVKGLPRGAKAGHRDRLGAALRQWQGEPGKNGPALAAALASARDYDGRLPDADLERELARIDWSNDRILLFVGRLISEKGLQNLIAALPRVLEAVPEARLLIVGHGPLREVAAALLWAFDEGDEALIRLIAEQGQGLEGGVAAPYEALSLYLRSLTTAATRDQPFGGQGARDAAARTSFLGYLTHRELKHLLPCSDVAVVPSMVPEAGPLVLLEALAAGSFPIGTYQAGMADIIDSVSTGLPAPVAELMKLTTDPSRVVDALADKAIEALSLDGAYKSELRRATIDRYDWAQVASHLAGDLRALADVRLAP